MVKYVSTFFKATLNTLPEKDLSNDAYVMFCVCVCVCVCLSVCLSVCVCVFFPVCLYKSICCGTSFELHRQVDAIQTGTHNISLYKVDNKYTGCNLKTTKFLYSALIGVYVVIRSNTVITIIAIQRRILTGKTFWNSQQIQLLAACKGGLD